MVEQLETRRACGILGIQSRGRPRNDGFGPQSLALLEQAAILHQEADGDRAAELLPLVEAHVATSEARKCIHWTPSSYFCLR